MYAVVLTVGLLGMPPGAIFTRLADADALVIAAGRVALATVILAPMLLVPRDPAPRWSRRTTAASGLAGFCLAVHFATWIASLQLTSIANSVALVSLSPLWLTLGMAVAARRLPRPAVAASVALALAGSIVIAFGSRGDPTGALAGDLLALIGGIAMAGYLSCGQVARRQAGLLSYVVGCYGVAALCLIALTLATQTPYRGLSAQTYGAIAAMALFSQVIGHSATNWALKHLAPGFVAVCLLAEPILGALFGYLYFAEAIAPSTAVGGGAILLAIYLGARAATRPPPDTP